MKFILRQLKETVLYQQAYFDRKIKIPENTEIGFMPYPLI